ncbi:MAG: hypothetical protein AAB783_00410 [Patescibacteria group bacterium]
MQKGFGLVMILIVIALALFIGGGSLFIKNVKTKQTEIQTGKATEEEAQKLKDKIESQDRNVFPVQNTQNN